MLTIKKMCFYMQNILHMITVNKIRMALTSIGILAAVFLYASGMILSESYYNSNLRVLDEMADHSVVLMFDRSAMSLIDKELEHYSDYRMTRDLVAEATVTGVLSSLTLEGDTTVLLTGRYHGMDGTGITPSFDEKSRYIPIEEELVEGRFFTMQEIERRAPVVVIDALTAEICYPGESAVGNKLTLHAEQRPDGSVAYVRAEIIGVVRNNYFSYMSREKLKKILEDPGSATDNLYRMETDLYCPYGFLDDNGLLSGFLPGDYLYVTYVFPDEQLYQGFLKEAVSTAAKAKERAFYIEIETFDTYRDALKADYSDMRRAINLVTLLLCVIAGISIMSITFFSVKERVAEIGIRKAFGAERMDILFQIVLETVFLSVFVSLIALLFSMMFCRGLEGYIQSSVMMTFRIHISVSKLFLPMAVGVLEAVVCCLLPAWYASRIQVVDALRFE